MLSPSAGLSFADCPNGVAALSKIPLYGLIQIFLFIGFLETQVRVYVYEKCIVRVCMNLVLSFMYMYHLLCCFFRG